MIEMEVDQKPGPVAKPSPEHEIACIDQNDTHIS
jgi:hypothetical protein